MCTHACACVHLLSCMCKCMHVHVHVWATLSILLLRFLVASADCLADYIHRHAKAITSLNHLERIDSIALTRCRSFRGVKRTLRSSWINYLMCIPRLSEPKAEIIVKEYPTFRSLQEAYLKCGNDLKKAELLLADLTRSDHEGNSVGRRVGPAISKWVHLCLTSNDPNTQLKA